MTGTDVTVLGLGAMGRALAVALLRAGRTVTVWNRTPEKADTLTKSGAHPAGSVAAAVQASPLVLVCVLDDETVHELIEPVAGDLRGRTFVNLTTTTPEQARAMARWAGVARVEYVDGGIMAVPDMIGGGDTFVLYSGAAEAFDRNRPVLELFGRAVFVGDDAGAAAMYDLALLGAMYAMFAGFEQGAAMVRGAGGTAGELAAMAAPFLQAMTGSFEEFAVGIDTPAQYEPVQSAEFTAAAIDTVARAGAEAGVPTALPIAVRAVLAGSIDAACP